MMSIWLIALWMPITSARYENLLNASNVSNSTLTNLKRILEFARSSPDFYPFTASVVYDTSDQTIVNLVSRFVARHSDGGFQTNATEYQGGQQYVTRLDLTWIFLVDDPHTLNAFIYWQRDFWQPKMQYIIVYSDCNDQIPWKHVFSYLWKKYNVYKVLIAIEQNNFQSAYTFSPFDVFDEHSEKKAVYGKIRELIFINENKILDGHPVLRNRKWQLRPEKVRDNREKSSLQVDSVYRVRKCSRMFEELDDLNGYNMSVTVFQSLMMNVERKENNSYSFTGLDADVLELLEHGLRAKFNMRVLSLEGTDPFQRALQLIHDMDTQIVVTSFFAKDYEQSMSYEFTASVSEDKLCFIVPDTGFMPKSQMPIMPFTKFIWTLLVIYNVLITIIWFFVKYFSRSFRLNEPLLIPLHRNELNKPPVVIKKVVRFERVWEPVENQKRTEKSRSAWKKIVAPEIHPNILSCCDLITVSCHTIQGADDSTSQRVFLFGTLFFGLIVGGLYQSLLVSSLSKPFHYPQINTIEAVAESNTTIMTKYTNLKENSFGENAGLERILKDKISVMNTPMPTIHLVAYRKVTALTRYLAVKLDNLTYYIDKDGNELIHIVDECLATYMLSYVVRLHSPYQERIDELLLRMQQLGLLQLWYDKMIRPQKIAEERIKAENSDRKIKLTLEHYQLTFIGLFMGLLFSSCVFVGELLYARCMNR